MSRRTQGLLVGASGGVALWLVASGDLTRYVKPSMRLPLLLAGGALALLGVATFVDRGRERSHTPKVAWLLAVPLIVVALAAPGPLGADAAREQGTREPDSAEDYEAEPLPAPTNGAVDLRMRDFVQRARHGDEHLVDEPVRLTGFIVHWKGDVHLVRFVIWCCAADATAYRVALRGLDGPGPADDTWVQIVGTWRPAPSGVDAKDLDYTVELNVETLTEIPAPENPYEVPAGLAVIR